MLVTYEWRITESELLCPHLTHVLTPDPTKPRPSLDAQYSNTHQISIKCFYLFFLSIIHLKLIYFQCFQLVTKNINLFTLPFYFSPFLCFFLLFHSFFNLFELTNKNSIHVFLNLLYNITNITFKKS